MFFEIYGDRNRSMNPEQVWSRLIEEVAELVEPMEKEKIREIENGIPDLFAWLMAFARKVPIELQSAAWGKFRKGCPSCGMPYDCVCGLAENGRVRQVKRELTVESFRREPATLDEWQEYFRELYGRVNEQYRPLALLTKFTQDVGNVARLLRKRAPEDLIESKVASVFAWLLAICNRYSATGKGEFKLSELVWKKYEGRCPSCIRSPCKCVRLTSLFVSYASELEPEMKELKRLAEGDFGLRVYVFPDLGPDFSQNGRMPAAFDAIAQADAAIILLGKTFSPRVYAETIEIFHRKFREYVLPYVRQESQRDKELSDLIAEIQMIHRYATFRSIEELRELARRDLERARDVSRRLRS